MAVHHRCTQVPARQVHVVHQQAHPHPPVGGLEQLVGEQPPDQIAMIQVVLHIDAALGTMGQHRPGHEGVQAVAQQMKAGFSRMRCGLDGDALTKGRVGCIRVGK